MSYAGIILTWVFANNLVLSQLLGLCPFLGVSRSPAAAMRFALASALLMPPFALAAWALERLVLVPLGVPFLQLLVLVLLLALSLLVMRLRARKSAPVPGIGWYLPQALSSCAVLGVGLLATSAGYGAWSSLVAGAAAAGGYLLAVVVWSALRERLDRLGVPRPLRGLPIALVTAGLMALAFLAFDELLLKNLLG
jgi:electron transport complex protein RnfA